MNKELRVGNLCAEPGTKVAGDIEVPCDQIPGNSKGGPAGGNGLSFIL